MIESQTKNLELLQKLKEEYERKDAQINVVREVGNIIDNYCFRCRSQVHDSINTLLKLY